MDDQNAINTDREITTETILEAEAFLNSLTFMQCFFPSRVDEVMVALHRGVDDNLNFALNLARNGLQALVPLMSDLRQSEEITLTILS